jgi:hypothetical protein
MADVKMPAGMIAWMGPVLKPQSEYNFKFHCANINDIRLKDHGKATVYIDA